MQSLADAIYDARVNHNLSRLELSLLLHVSKGTVGQWERGKNGIKKAYIPLVAEVLSIDVRELTEMNSVYDARRSPPKYNEPLPPIVKPSIYLLCGDCRQWARKANQAAEGIHRMGYCKALGIMTERCDWCRKEASK